MIERIFKAMSKLFGKPLFWLSIVNILLASFCLNVLSHNHFDPGMNYSNFLQNWLQLLALAVTSVATVATADAMIGLHEKHDALHDKVDGIHGKINGSN